MTVDIFAELPLAIFSTLVPLGAGAFIPLLVAALTLKDADETLQKMDRFAIIPLAVLVIGLIAAFFHLASPLNAFNTLSGFGRSPLSTEIVVVSVLVTVAAVYWILGIIKKLSNNVRKMLLAVLSVLAAVAAVFTGLAYYIATIPGWACIWPVLSILGIMFLGTGIGAFAAQLSGAANKAVRIAVAVCMLVGAVLVLCASLTHVLLVGEMSSVLVSGSVLVAAAKPYLIAATICVFLAAAAGIYAVIKDGSIALYGIAIALMLVGAFCARLMFYCLQLGLAL